MLCSHHLQRHAKEVLMKTSSNPLTEDSSGASAMDKLHQNVFQALDELAVKSDSEFRTEYGVFVAKMEQIFREEEQWMDAIDYSVSMLHREQHARVLGALHNVHSRVMYGEIGVGREVVERLLPQWFSFHASTMDAALARAMQNTKAGCDQRQINVLPVP
jgi:hemerythrin